MFFCKLCRVYHAEICDKTRIGLFVDFVKNMRFHFRMGKINSRNKGAVAEREVAKILNDNGWTSRRGQQFSGGKDSPDVVSTFPLHIEVKRVEKFNLYDAVEQAKRDSQSSDDFCVVHRKNNHEWVGIVTFNKLMELMKGKRFEEKLYNAKINGIIDLETYQRLHVALFGGIYESEESSEKASS